MRRRRASYVVWYLTKTFNRLYFDTAAKILLGRQRKNPEGIRLTGDDRRLAMRLMGFLGRAFREGVEEAEAEGRKTPAFELMANTWNAYAAAIRHINQRLRRGVREITLRYGTAEWAAFCNAVQAFATPAFNRRLYKEWVIGREFPTRDVWKRFFGFSHAWLKACR